MTTAALVEEITVKVSALPFELQRETLDFIEFIAQRKAKGTSVGNVDVLQRVDPVEVKPPVKSVIGCLEHLGVHITDEDIAEVRREMWANFPREFPQ